MAGLGIGPVEFALFRIPDPEERADALERGLTPSLVLIGNTLVGGLSRLVGANLSVHPGKLAKRKGTAPEEVFVAFCIKDTGYRAGPYLALAVTRSQLHARVAVRASADRDGAIRRALKRESANLARKGRPFRKLRSYAAWDFEELPEIAPACSTAFWFELAEALVPGHNGSGILDVGIAWPSEEVRSLAIGDVLGAYRDLAPLYKLLANAL
ncbi:MAG TPA: DUF1054 family protein [Anaeromyxobacteraceae bacterium]|nr:DUF1054 family protein [Anaeromyxobacteraceae bacterium]